MGVVGYHLDLIMISGWLLIKKGTGQKITDTPVSVYPQKRYSTVSHSARVYLAPPYKCLTTRRSPLRNSSASLLIQSLASTEAPSRLQKLLNEHLSLGIGQIQANLLAGHCWFYVVVENGNFESSYMVIHN